MQNKPVKVQPDEAALFAAKISQYSDLQLCQASKALEPALNVNPSSHPEYKTNLRHSKALDAAAKSRRISCYRIMDANTQPAKPLMARQKQARASTVCWSVGQRTQFSNPDAVVQMCMRGYRYSPGRCTRDLDSFSEEAAKLNGFARAELTELGNGLRIGCNLQ